MTQRDQCVGLAATVGQSQLADDPVVLACQPQHHIPHQLAQIVGGEGQRKEMLRPLVDRALPALHYDLVEVGGKHVHRQFAGTQVVPQRDYFVPWFPW